MMCQENKISPSRCLIIMSYFDICQGQTDHVRLIVERLELRFRLLFGYFSKSAYSDLHGLLTLVFQQIHVCRLGLLVGLCLSENVPTVLLLVV